MPQQRGVGRGLLLDKHSGAEVALSLRKLRSGYSGTCIRVRRSSDDAEQDIGFDGGVVDEQELLDFANGGDVFVTTWYDQSGNAHDATQSTLADQPQIVASGSIITQGGNPAVQTTSGYLTSGSPALTQPFSVFGVWYMRDTASFEKVWGGGSNFEVYWEKRDNDNTGISANLTLSAAKAYPSREVWVAHLDGASSIVRWAKTDQATGDGGGNDMTGVSVGADGGGRSVADADVQEVIFYSTLQKSNEDLIEQDQIDHYGI